MARTGSGWSHQPPSRRRHRRGISTRQKLFEDPLGMKISRWRWIDFAQDASSDKVAAASKCLADARAAAAADASQERRWRIGEPRQRRLDEKQLSMPIQTHATSLIYQEHRSIRAYAGFASGLPPIASCSLLVSCQLPFSDPLPPPLTAPAWRHYRPEHGNFGKRVPAWQTRERL